MTNRERAHPRSYNPEDYAGQGWMGGREYEGEGEGGRMRDDDYGMEGRLDDYSRENDYRSPGPHTGRGPRGYQRSDERIRDDVCELLTRHGQIDASHIEVDVQQGEVTLRGTVDSRRVKRLAGAAIEDLPGVRDVHNQLRIGQPEQG